ncbi:MAG: CoA pyrophosphatase [Planctomycetaceae bacterium]|nr:CoA pyrophosphatase [Planctomycetaceae bacterium]
MTLADLRNHFCCSPFLPNHIHELAAVALIFREADDDLEILLIRRADREDDPWSGHIAFPGGRMSPADHSPQATAERETLEEIGLDLTHYGECVGSLEPESPMKRTSGTNLLVVPYLYSLDHEPEKYVLNHEVAELFWVRIGPMLLRQNLTKFHFEHEGRSHVLPGFNVNGHTLWGMSYRMLTRVFSTIEENL